mmetsp:Transcript_23382/g.59122  ORF Transcript_23382/g.59122 Transcript_23382/m.59122 type:complete len:320 (-) Transcript_23382:24-983(-)
MAPSIPLRNAIVPSPIHARKRSLRAWIPFLACLIALLASGVGAGALPQPAGLRHRAAFLHAPWLTHLGQRRIACAPPRAGRTVLGSTKTRTEAPTTPVPEQPLPSPAETAGKGGVGDPFLERMSAELDELDRRLMLPPEEPGCTVIETPDVVEWDRVKAQGSRGEEASKLARLMARDHFAVVRLPEEEATTVAAMWDAARDFGNLPTEAKYAAAGRMSRLPNMVGVVGFGVMEDSNEFLELRINSKGELVPGEEGLDAAVGGFSDRVMACRKALTAVGVGAVEAACHHVGGDVDKVRDLVEHEASLDPALSEISATQHR